jgi:arylsulfatase
MTKPNILLIITDQHRYDCLGSTGNRQVQTPRLDQLAGDAVNFTNSYCPYAVCTPSRYSLFTGLYVHQHRGRTNRCSPGAGIMTFPRALSQAGYKTKAVGKMHMTPTYLDIGFQQMELAEQDGEGRLDDDYHRDLRDQGLVDFIDLVDQRLEFRRRAPEEYWEKFGAVKSNLPEKWHSTTWIGDRAARSIEDWGDDANLLTVSFVKPHHPFDPPAPWHEMYDPDKIDPLPGWMPKAPQRDLDYHHGYFPYAKMDDALLRHIMAHYYASITQIDHHVGRMIDTLKRKGLYEDTMILFTSDHGEYLGFHHLLLKNNYYYDPVVRVPLLIKFPGNRDGGTRRDTLTSNIDLGPTVLGQTSASMPATMRGLDLANPEANRDFVFAEAGYGRNYMARSRTHKLILANDPRESLFIDMENDPLEMNNLFDDPASQDIIREHRDAIANWLMFGALVPSCCNENAPCLHEICQPNVNGADKARREDMLKYFEEKAAPMFAK